MKLSEYIEKYDYKIMALARRCGVSDRAIRYFLEGADMKLSTAAKIVEATHQQVTFEDLASSLKSQEKTLKPKKNGKKK